MVKSIRLEPSLSLEQLTFELSVLDRVEGQLIALGHEDAGPYTIATVDERHRATGSLRLVLSHGKEVRAPADSAMLCRGVVYIGGVLQQITAFRESPARFRGTPGQLHAEISALVKKRSASTDMTERHRLLQQIRLVKNEIHSMDLEMGSSASLDALRGFDSLDAVSALGRRVRKLGERGDTDALLSAPLDPREYRVWFGTNRKPVDGESAGKLFSSERDTTVHYGHCDVYVPRSHKIGSIGQSRLIRWITGKDDRLKIHRWAGLEADDFWAAVRGQIESAAPGARHAVVFIHGYRMSFRDAALRAAQIGFDLGIEGAMGFFSWPSKGVLLGYPADERALEGSEAVIADFLVDFARYSGAEMVHVIAHSMGNRGLLRAADRIVADAARRTACRFGQFILAAADVDAGNFRDLAGAYKALAQRTTLYVSSKDLAVQISRWIGNYARVGFHPPVMVVENIDTVSVTNVDLTLLGHGYVAEARPVLQDMERLISTNQPPPRFGHEEARTPDGRRYWNMRA
jgi:esterase/lipase superfamily enzyme